MKKEILANILDVLGDICTGLDRIGSALNTLATRPPNAGVKLGPPVLTFVMKTLAGEIGRGSNFSYAFPLGPTKDNRSQTNFYFNPPIEGVIERVYLFMGERGPDTQLTVTKGGVILGDIFLSVVERGPVLYQPLNDILVGQSVGFDKNIGFQLSLKVNS